ncbi:hypothetical protein [Tautonia sociabilis]|uniref:Uncharacterized protein n=1 Tax=Tautonia sociabilis TaxID=2080755 RepID=A0A432MQ33_9BACT|nr:hypothetical protein [Tautonia sociabilis]RUL89603.1 hypothetical protein TsocGM_00060 [Tautonia sociabilis]
MSMNLDAYATDEDVALTASDDLGTLFPADQVLASGLDGAFSPADRRTLTSASVDFAAAGIASGHVVRLVGPPEFFRTPGTLLGVSASSSGSLTLRRLGLEAGAPIAPPEGLTGVEFVSTTLAPQLSQASRELDRILGLDPPSPGSPPLDADASEALRDAVVLLVLARRYAAMAREEGDTFATRARLFREEFEALVTRLSSIGSILGPGRAPRPGTRLIR